MPRHSRAPASALARSGHGDVAGAVLVAGVVLSLLAAFVAWPVVRLLWVSVSGADGPTLARYRAFFGAWPLLRILGNSLALAATSTTATVALALALAFAMTRVSVPGARLLSPTTLLPLVSPPFFGSLALIVLLGRDGVITSALRLDWSIEGFTGIVVAQVLAFLPHAYILLSARLGARNAELEEAAENLGAGPLATFRRITLALARGGLASAALVVFVLCLADFGNPLLIGGRIEVLATAIYAQVAGPHDLAAAATMSGVLVAPCLAAYLLDACWVGRRSLPTAKGAAPAAGRPAPPLVRWPLLLLWGAVALAVAVLYGLVPLASLVRVWGGDWSLLPARGRLGSGLEGAWPVWNSVKLALASGVVGTALALLAAHVVTRRRTSLGPSAASAIEFLTRLPAALPGTVIGVAYLLAFGAPPLPLGGTLAILVASVVFWKLPVAMLAGVSALARIDPGLEEVAASLGASTARTVVRIVLPLLTGTALSIFVYFFINAMVTVSAVIFLVHPGFGLGAVAVLAQAQGGDPAGACALGAIILAIVLGAVAALRAIAGDRVAILEP